MAPLCFALGLLAGEGMVGVIGYLVAYAVFLDPGTSRQRVRSLLPYAGILVVWRLAYQQLGFGAVGSGFYADPVRDPIRFVAAVIERAPVLLLAQFSDPPADAYPIVSVAQQGEILRVAGVVLPTLALLLLPLLRHDRLARFWATGMLAAVVPISATIPEDRLLVFVGIGTFGLIARLLDALWCTRATWLPAARSWRVPAHLLAGGLVVVHGVLAPWRLPARSDDIVTVFSEVTNLARSVPPTPRLPQQQVIVVQGGLPVAFYYSDILAADNQPVPRRWRVLAPETAVRVTRVDDRTLRIRPREGYLPPPTSDDFHVNMARRFDTFVRAPERSLALGDRIALAGLDIEVTAMTGDGRPAEATFRFDVPLEDDSLRWLVPRGQAYVPFRLPAVGESVRLDAVRG